MIKDRVIQVLEYKRIPKESFYTKVGITSANFRGKAKNTPLNSTTIENILSEVPDLDLYWLLTGKGNMLLGMNTEFATKTTEERLLEIIKEKDAKIEDLARLIGRLESMVELLQKKATSPNDEVANS